jgi:hypothetical protein
MVKEAASRVGRHIRDQHISFYQSDAICELVSADGSEPSAGTGQNSCWPRTGMATMTALGLV